MSSGQFRAISAPRTPNDVETYVEGQLLRRSNPPSRSTKAYMCLLPGPKHLVIGYHHHYSRSLGVNTAAHTLHGYSAVRGKESIVTQWFELLIGHHHATSDPPPAPSPHPWRGRYAPPCKAGHNLRVVPPDQLGQVQADFARRLDLANVARSSLGTEAMEEAVAPPPTKPSPHKSFEYCRSFQAAISRSAGPLPSTGPLPCRSQTASPA